jgi:hypothetical protein
MLESGVPTCPTCRSAGQADGGNVGFEDLHRRAGALGSTAGGVLTEGGNEGWLIGKYSANVAAMDDTGLRMLEGVAERIVKVRARTTTVRIGPADPVTVLVKFFHTRQAVESAAPVIGPVMCRSGPAARRRLSGA